MNPQKCELPVKTAKGFLEVRLINSDKKEGPFSGTLLNIVTQAEQTAQAFLVTAAAAIAASASTTA